MAAPGVPLVLVDVDVPPVVEAPGLVLVGAALDGAIVDVPALVDPVVSAGCVAVELPFSPPAWLVDCAIAMPVKPNAAAIAPQITVRLNTECIVDLL
jgi:hypothetical protein